MSISADINTLRRDLAQRAETCGILAGHRWRSARERATDEALRAAYDEMAARLDVVARHAAEVEAALSELAATMREDFRGADGGEIVRAYASRLDVLVDGGEIVRAYASRLDVLVDGGGEAGHVR